MSGMAEVLAGHQRDHEKRTLHQHCTCGWFGNVLQSDFTAHQAAMLSAAGFGPVKEAAAKALEEAADDYRHYETPNARLYLRARAAAVRGEG